MGQKGPGCPKESKTPGYIPRDTHLTATKGHLYARPCAKCWECPVPWQVCPHGADGPSQLTVSPTSPCTSGVLICQEEASGAEVHRVRRAGAAPWPWRQPRSFESTSEPPSWTSSREGHSPGLSSSGLPSRGRGQTAAKCDGRKFQAASEPFPGADAARGGCRLPGAPRSPAATFRDLASVRGSQGLP